MKPKPIDAEKLGKRLAEYSSLDKAIEAMEAEMASLQPRVEELKRNQANLETEVQGLSKKRMILKEELENLEHLKQALSQTVEVMQSQKKQLENYLPRLETGVRDLEVRKTTLQQESSKLDEERREREEKLKTISEVESKLEEKTKLLEELETKVSGIESKLRLFEGFLGLLKANTETEIEEALKHIPGLVKGAQSGKYSPDFIREFIVSRLTRNTYDIMTCSECDIEFVVTKGAKTRSPYATYKTAPEHCPICGNSYSVFHKETLSKALRKVLE